MRSLVAAAIGLTLLAGTVGAVRTTAADYPAVDSRYHSYPEMVSHVKGVAAAHPDIVRVFSIGTSYGGRKLWAAEVSDNVGRDEGEPEVLFDGLHHAREHLSAEMSIYILDMLTRQYGKSSDVGRRVTKQVDGRRTWIVFMANPDGLQYDLTGSPYRSWRKNRQPTPGSSGDRYRHQPQLRLPLRLLRRLIGRTRRLELPWTGGLVDARGPRPARLRQRSRGQRAAAHPHPHQLPHRRRAGAVAVLVYARTCRRT